MISYVIGVLIAIDKTIIIIIINMFFFDFKLTTIL